MREMARYEFNRSDYERAMAQQGFWNLRNEKMERLGLLIGAPELAVVWINYSWMGNLFSLCGSRSLFPKRHTPLKKSGFKCLNLLSFRPNELDH